MTEPERRPFKTEDERLEALGLKDKHLEDYVLDDEPCEEARRLRHRRRRGTSPGGPSRKARAVSDYDAKAENRRAFSSKPRALRAVSSAVAALIEAGGVADLFGYDPDLTDAQRARLEWAMDLVARRLFNMGGEE